MADASRILVKAGIRPSLQRIAVLEYLMQHHTHPTADSIYNGLASDIPTLSRTTVYNTLHLLSENGVIQMLTIEGEQSRFDADTSSHAHFQCMKCGQVLDIFKPDAASDEREFVCGHRIHQCHIYYKGICKDCLSI